MKKICNMKKNFIIGIIALFLLLSVSEIIALGITPGRTTLTYEEGGSEEIIFTVLNNEKKSMNVVLMVDGSLKDAVKISGNDLVKFSPEKASEEFKAKISLPANIKNEAGLHTVDIIALELPTVNEQGIFVGATVAVVSQLYVYVPCPGKCIETDLELFDGEENMTAVFVVPVINRGKLGIGNVRAVIDVYNSVNEQVESLETDSWSVEAGARTELSAQWNITLPSGEYLAKVSVFYDGETKNFDKRIEIGSETITIESIFSNDFRLGEIAELEVLVQNKKDKPLDNVFAHLLVYNEDDQIMADAKSPDEDISALSSEQLTVYWDTVGVSEGEYDGSVKVVYGEKQKEKNLIMRVSEDRLDIFGVGYVIQPRGGRGFTITTVLWIIIGVLILINIAWFVFFRRMMEKRRKV